MTGRSDLDGLFSRAYEELRRLAAAVRGNDPAETLNPTALVHEAWLKLASSLPARPGSELHFKRIAARAMRQVLVETARRRGASRRGGGRPLLTLDESLRAGVETSHELLALDAALDRLAEMAPRQAQMVEYRFFGGLEVAETAELLGVSESTVHRDWRAARAWLGVELGRER